MSLIKNINIDKDNNKLYDSTIKCGICERSIENPKKINFLNDIYFCDYCKMQYQFLFKLNENINTLELNNAKKKLNRVLLSSKAPKETINKLNNYIESRREDAEKLDTQQQQHINKLKEESRNILLTTGYNFEGYNIIKYHGIVTGESVIGTGIFSSLNAEFADTFGNESTSYNKKLSQARELAKERAIFEAINSGGNAIIGINFNYINFSSDKIGAVFTGTCVTIKKHLD